MSEESLRLRQGIYRVLSAGFAPPSPAFLEVAADATTVLEELGLYDYSYAPMVTDMLHEFGAADAEELSRSYEQLFETGIAGEVCHPRESIRLGNARTGETAVLLADLRTTQEGFGLTVPPDRIDHATTELTSLAALCGRAADSTDDAELLALLGHQADFAHDHVLRWMPDLGRQVVESAPHPALRALGTATVAFLEHERQHLPILIAEHSVAPP